MTGKKKEIRLTMVLVLTLLLFWGADRQKLVYAEGIQEEETIEGENICLETEEPEEESEEQKKEDVCQEPPKIRVEYGAEPAELQEGLYFREDPDLLLLAEASEGIAQVEYAAEEGIYEILKELENEEQTVCELSLNETSPLKEQLTDMEDGTYVWSFRVTDQKGEKAETRVEFRIDKTAPDRDIFVSWHSDGTNPKASRGRGIERLVSTVLDRMFGKKNICFDLYIRDRAVLEEEGYEPSGIDLEDLKDQLQTMDGKAVIRDFQRVEEGLVSFLYDGGLQEGYVHMRGCIVMPSDDDQDMEERLCIRRLRDRAGNTAGETDAKELTGTTILYFDRTSPVLSADYGNGIMDEECGKLFYQEEAKIRLTVTEERIKDFTDEEGNPVLPLVYVSSCGEKEEAAGEWTGTDSGVFMEVRIPPSKNEETEYEIIVEYQDGSGNLLETDKTCLGTAEQGVYRSCPIVVDQRAPELTAFSIEGKTHGQAGGIEVYEHAEEEDVFFSFTIDDHASYWNPSGVQLTVRNRETGRLAAEINGSGLYWDTNGCSHHAVYGFDGEGEEKVYSYEVILSYKDRAGNFLTGKGASGDRIENGTYCSEAFLLDHQAPEFYISFPKAFRLVREDADPSFDRFGSTLEAGYTAYYGSEVEVCFSIREYSAEPVYDGHRLVGLKDFVLTITGRDESSYQPEVSWERKEELYEGTFVLSKEDQYEIAVSYMDLAGNVMSFGQAEGSKEEVSKREGIYKSVPIVLDRTPPAVHLSYVNMVGEEAEPAAVFSGDGRVYFAEPVYLKLEAKDENIRCHELLESLRGTKITKISNSLVSDSSVSRFLSAVDRSKTGNVTFYIPLSTEASYEFPTEWEDLAGNICSVKKEKVSVDRTDPELDLSYSAEESGYLDAVRYRDIRYLFADHRMIVTVSAKDLCSGIWKIRYIMEGEDGNRTEKTETFEPMEKSVCTFAVPFHGRDFKGTVMVEAWDWSGNHVSQDDGYIVESSKKHEETCRAQIETITEPGRTVGSFDYFQTDVRFRLTVEDHYSGLRAVSCTGGSTVDVQKDYTEEGIVSRHSEELMLEALHNNENEVPVRVAYEDNAGHKGELEQRYNIDVTPPVLEVAYDQNHPSAGGYYRQARTAVITVQERNFDPSDAEFLFTSSEGKLPLVGPWETSGEGDARLHVCRVLFAEDGAYTFSVNVTDFAGNRTEYGKTDEFIIDQTPPILNVHYDDTESRNQIYYAKGRTAVIEIVEHNFDAALIHITAEAESEGAVPSISGWSHEGDSHRAFVSFSADGTYTFGIAGMDQAENEMESYGTERFIIDQTAPLIAISGVEHRSANGGAVMPEIRCTDRNYQTGQMEILLTGCLHGAVDLKGTRSIGIGEECFRMEDFAYFKEEDDLYELTVRAYDLAGNESFASVLFSVNRFGSVYTLDAKTELLAGERGSYYTNTEPDITVTETNADTLEFQEITCSLNGKLYTLKEGTDYFVHTSGTNESWKQYVYSIPAKNFQEEGIYVLTIYSEDRARNASDNHAKGKKIEFAVDKTSPSILLSGVEDGGRYRENSREITLDIQDNLMTAEVKVFVNGIESVYHASEVQEQKGRIRLMAGSSNQWQSIRVTASDAAGNRRELKERTFLITPNLFIQFFMNKKLFYRSLGGLAAVWAVTWYFLFRRWRRRLK